MAARGFLTHVENAARKVVLCGSWTMSKLSECNTTPTDRQHVAEQQVDDLPWTRGQVRDPSSDWSFETANEDQYRYGVIEGDNEFLADDIVCDGSNLGTACWAQAGWAAMAIAEEGQSRVQLWWPLPCQCRVQETVKRAELWAFLKTFEVVCAAARVHARRSKRAMGQLEGLGRQVAQGSEANLGWWHQEMKGEWPDVPPPPPGQRRRRIPRLQVSLTLREVEQRGRWERREAVCRPPWRFVGRAVPVEEIGSLVVRVHGFELRVDGERDGRGGRGLSSRSSERQQQRWSEREEQDERRQHMVVQQPQTGYFGPGSTCWDDAMKRTQLSHCREPRYQRTHGERTNFWDHWMSVFGRNWWLWPWPFRTHPPADYREPAYPDQDTDGYTSYREEDSLGIAGTEYEAAETSMDDSATAGTGHVSAPRPRHRYGAGDAPE
ncbi:unnamed protein product [Prorocentrum cordatum]|uniref:Phospholipase B-like n=1 Tax=Prorocentrum cordatum TaxID=2364126 RepID=A0ABN9V465_9DINO|nr:unnamed protein product [Polarella glacialis]